MDGMDAELKAEDYIGAMDDLVLIARLIQSIPLDFLRDTVLHAETQGPILHPTEYRNADLKSQRTLVDAACAFRAAVAPVVLPVVIGAEDG